MPLAFLIISPSKAKPKFEYLNRVRFSKTAVLLEVDFFNPAKLGNLSFSQCGVLPSLNTPPV